LSSRGGPAFELPSSRAFHLAAPYGAAVFALGLSTVIALSTSDGMAYAIMAATGVTVIFWLCLVRRAFRDVGGLAWVTIPSGVMAVLAVTPFPCITGACLFGKGCL